MIVPSLHKITVRDWIILIQETYISFLFIKFIVSQSD